MAKKLYTNILPEFIQSVQVGRMVVTKPYMLASQ